MTEVVKRKAKKRALTAPEIYLEEGNQLLDLYCMTELISVCSPKFEKNVIFFTGKLIRE